MAEYSGFFNAQGTEGNYDRVYNASDFASYFALFIKDGVFIDPADQLKVIPKTGLTVTLKAGRAFIEGYWYRLTEDMDFTLNPNSSSSSTQNVIAIKLNKTTRLINAIKRENVDSILPVNNGTEHELVVASILLGAGVSTISGSVITDRRPQDQYCGFVTGTVDQIDFDGIYSQFEAQFNEWFEGIKEEFADDPAGGLQNQIDALSTRIGALETKANSLQSQITNINGKTAIVRATFQMTSGMYGNVRMNYPAGFNMNNCCIKSCMMRRTGSSGAWVNDWVSLGGQYGNGYYLQAALTQSNINVHFSSDVGSTGFKGGYEAFVVLEKIV